VYAGDIYHHKGLLRTRVKSERLSLSPDEVKRRSLGVTRILTGWAEYIRAGSVMAYVSFRNEVDTREFLRRVLSDGKTLCLPRVIRSERRLVPVAVDRLNALQPGAYGIPEPPADWPPADASAIDMICVPGVAFDGRGGRLGFGGGYYDRFLRDLRGPVRVGLAYEFQVLDRVPVGPVDVLLDYLCTERRIIECRSPGGATP